MFFIAGNHGQFPAAGDGGDEGIVVGQRLVSGLGHEASPFHGGGFVKRKNRVAIILKDKTEGALQGEPRLGVAFQFDAAPDFGQREGGDANFSGMGGEPGAKKENVPPCRF